MAKETKDEVVTGSEVQPEVNAEAPAETTAEEVASPHKGFFGKVDAYFGITKAKSNFKTEIIAGLTTFMAMVYILIVNPGMFSEIEGLSFGGMYIATAIGAIVGTLLMAFLAKMPLAQASGMGVNAFVVYTLVLYGEGLTYANAMVFTLLDGVIFVILTTTGLRKYIFKAIPEEVKKAITVGLGMFIAYIGFQNAGFIVGDSATLSALVSFNVLKTDFMTYSGGTVGGILPALVVVLGVIAIAVLSYKKVKGAILWGILGSTALYFILAGFTAIAGGESLVTVSFTNWAAEGQPATTATYTLEQFKLIAGTLPEGANVSYLYTNGEAAKQMFAGIASSMSNPFSAFVAWGQESAGKVFYEGFNFENYLGAEGNSVGSLILLLVTTALSLCMLDMFDTLGTLYGACEKGGLLDKEGNPLNMNRCMLSDSIATCVGAIAGTSTVTTFVESSAGVAVGGKTGFTALITGLCFIVAMFLSPIAQIIPSAATATALVWVGVLMMSSVGKIDWTNPIEALPAFLTIAVMAFGYEISYGIGIGIISSVIVRLCAGKVKSISVVTWIIAVFFLATFILTH